MNYQALRANPFFVVLLNVDLNAFDTSKSAGLFPVSRESRQGSQKSNFFLSKSHFMLQLSAIIHGTEEEI